MKILVPVKRVVDYNIRVRLNADGDAVQTDNVRKSLNPFDETAIEEAVRLKERGAASEVVAVSIGSSEAGETVRTALAVGADRGILIDCGAAVLEPSAVAKILKILCEREAPDLVLCGRQAIDDDAAQMGPMLAMRLGWAQGIGASKIDIADGAGDLEVRCEMGSGTRTLRLSLPAVIAVDLRLNEPRYVTLPGIMRAKKKTLEILPVADFPVDLAPQTEQIALRETPPRQGGVSVGNAADFLNRLFAKRKCPMSVLVLAEHDGERLDPATARAMTAALAMGGPVHVLVAGEACIKVAEAAARLAGVAKVLLVDAPRYGHLLDEPTAALLAAHAEPYDTIAAAATGRGKSILPRTAAKIDAPQISEIVKVLAPDTFERPIYAGSILQRVRCAAPKKIVTVRTSSFAPVGDQDPAPIETAPSAADPGVSQFVCAEVPATGGRPDLANAKIVVAGGRGMINAKGFDLVLKLADRLGAAVGASRAAVDAGLAPNDCQIGQSGRSVAPDIYIAIGISGAQQHLAGIRDAKIVAAINKDPQAPIFQVADIAFVGDLFEAIPALEAALAKRGYISV